MTLKAFFRMPENAEKLNGFVLKKKSAVTNLMTEKKEKLEKKQNAFAKKKTLDVRN